MEPTPSPSEKTTDKPVTLSPVSSPLTEEECCVDTGVCSPENAHEIPLLDLSVGGSTRPAIDGMIGNEYSTFLEFPMYNGGKNNGDDQIATAYMAYDCSSNVVCIAARLDESFIQANPSTQVEQDDNESWIRFGHDDGTPKLKPSNADEFRYVGKITDPFFIIGYEGCWTVDTVVGMRNIINNYVEVHFSNVDGDTTSTGKPASNGEYVCLTPICEPVRPLVTFGPTSLPTAKPTEVSSSHASRHLIFICVCQ